MSKFNELAKGKHSKIVSDWTKSVCPLVYCYAPTGKGKTQLARDLLRHKCYDGSRPFAPVLYIDGDDGSATIREYTENDKLCKLRAYDGLYDDKLGWFYEQLDAAEHEECGSIVIEGFTALFKSMLSPKLRALSNITEGLWTAHNEPAQHMDNIFEAVKKVKVNRRCRGMGVPIYGTFNVREINKDPENANAGKMFVPDFSPNRTRSAMLTSDAFLELRRNGDRTVLLCNEDTHNAFRKLRGDAAATVVEKAVSLSLPGLFYVWAIESARAKRKLSKELADEYAAAQAEDEAANPTTPDQETSAT